MIRINNIKRKLRKVTAVVGSALSCFIILSCSFDEPWSDLSTTSIDSEEDIYLPITITDDGTPLLLNKGDDNAATDANFYFYDENGIFVTRGTILDESKNNLGSISNSGTSSGNVRLVVLSGISDRNYPAYVVAVINKPADFDYTLNLADMQAIKSTGTGHGIYQDDTGKNFIMTSSTYLGASDDYNFVTKISPDNYILNTADLSTAQNVLEIPVERLAAKVTVKLDDNVENWTNRITLPGNNNLYVYKVHDDPTYYVELIGWKINAIARDSYMFKNLDDTWTTSSLWDNWNDNDNTRCYWAKSYYYGENDSSYPTSNIIKDEQNDDIQSTSTYEEGESEFWLSPYVEYVDLSSGLKSFGNSAYCPENTNTAGIGGIIEDAYSTAITSVLIKAKVYDASGTPLGADRVGNADGYIYYNIPIKHNTSSTSSSVSEGDYGVVRNHHYVITITGVDSLGAGYDDENAVIVPVNEATVKFTTFGGLWSSNEEDVYVKVSGDKIIDVTDEQGEQ